MAVEGGKTEVKEASKLSEHARGLLKMTRDTEFLQSFLRVDLGNDSDPEETKTRAIKSALKKPIQQEPSIPSLSFHPEPSSSSTPAPEKQHRDGDVTPRAVTKTTFNQLTRDMKLTKKPYKMKKRGKERRQEEFYTDRDRAATVIMGCRDIKLSLREKRRLDRSRALQIPDEADPGTLLALGNHEMRSGDVKIAINFVHKALELNPSDKNALVARSKCYLLLGEPQKALEDAETAMQGDKTFIRAIFQKAEALYHLGDFEHSLMYYHRGQRIRPELEGFRLGVQKAQEAIENTIGGKTIRCAPKKPVSPVAPSDDTTVSVMSNSGSKRSDSSRSKSRPGSNNSRRRPSSHLLGELSVDKIYLEKLLNHPDIKSPHQESASHITSIAEEGIAFLNNRQEFWRQQRSNNSDNKKAKKQLIT